MIHGQITGFALCHVGELHDIEESGADAFCSSGWILCRNSVIETRDAWVPTFMAAMTRFAFAFYWHKDRSQPDLQLLVNDLIALLAHLSIGQVYSFSVSSEARPRPPMARNARMVECR
jgi:hypothetical protein